MVHHNYAPSITAEQISSALGGRRSGPDSYVALCPSHAEKTPSFTITQAQDKVLVHCFGGCSQDDVIEALRAMLLWNEKSEPRAIESKYDTVEAIALCRAYEEDRKHGIQPTTKERNRYRQTKGILCSPYTIDDVAEMHFWCLVYRANVRSGALPTAEESEKFMRYQAIVVERGVPCEW